MVEKTNNQEIINKLNEEIKILQKKKKEQEQIRDLKRIKKQLKNDLDPIQQRIKQLDEVFKKWTTKQK